MNLRDPRWSLALEKGDQVEARKVTGDDMGQAETLQTLGGALCAKLRHQNLVQKG